MLKVLVVVAVVVAMAGAAAGEVIAPRITTNQSVDTHSLESIVADVVKPGMTDEQKAIALYEYARRVMFHFEQRGEKLDQAYDLDALRLINTYGYSFCTQQMLVLVHLWNTAGVKGKVWSVPGHSTAQAFYGGKTHWFDPLIGAYVFSRTDKTVASLKEIADDPTVLTKAAADGRACPAFVPCEKVLANQSARFVTNNPKYVAFCASFGNDVGYMAANATKAKIFGGPRKCLYQPDIALRRGETVTFLWDALEGEYNVKPGIPAKQLPPNHYCGIAADRKDPLNAPYWTPYTKTINGVAVCRYHANGTVVFAPKFGNEYSKKDFESSSFAWYGWGRNAPPHLRVRKAGRPANVVYTMSTPHVFTNATLTAEFHRATAEDVSRLYVSRDAGVTWTPVWDGTETKADTGAVTASVTLKDHVRGLRDFLVRAECATEGDVKNAGLHGIKVEAVFQHNMFARPFLGPGRNEITVRLANPETLKADPFTVTYVWQEDGQERTHTQRITESPMTYTINVGGAAMPRMVRLDLAVAP